MNQQLRRGLFITTERPSVVGGLGRVSVDIPMALNTHAHMDCRVMQPMTRIVRELDSRLPEKERFQDTYLRLSLESNGGGKQDFQLWQRFEPGTATWVYAVVNQLWERFDHLYFPLRARFDDALLKKVFGSDAIFNVNMMYTRAASAFARYLQPGARLSDGICLSRFAVDMDFVLLNDWLTGQAAHELFHAPFSELGDLAPPVLADCACLFMIHNVYDEKRSIKQAQEVCLDVPTYVMEELKVACKAGKDAQRAVRYSPLRTGIRQSDWLIVDGNYLRTLTTCRTRLPARTISDLKGKRSAQQFTTVVHAPNHTFNPVGNRFLVDDGFVCMPPEFFNADADATKWQAALHHFKQVNKAAVQAHYSDSTRVGGYLKPDAEALIYSWAARFEPYQKGFFLMSANIKQFMLTHPRVQLVIAGGGGVDALADKLIGEFIHDLLNDARLKGRFVRAGETDADGRFMKLDENGLVQLLSGTTALLHPSLYEPYGLSQLESMWLGAIPLGHGVDGLLTTIKDLHETADGGKEASRPAERCGATGFLMESVGSPLIYELALRSWIAIQTGSTAIVPLSASKQAFLANANSAFAKLLERSYAALENDQQRLQLAFNGMRYVHEEHDWSKISQRYRLAVESAIERKRQKKTMPLSVNA